MRFARRLAAVLALAALGACDDGPVDPGTRPPEVNVPLTCPAGGAGTLSCAGGGKVGSRWTAEVAVLGSTAYTSTWGGLPHPTTSLRGDVVYIWNIEGNTPLIVDSLVLTGVRTTSDVQVDPTANLLVVSHEGSVGGGLAIYNVANPRSPQLLTRWQPAAAAPGIHTVKLGRINGVLHAFASVNNGSLLIASLANPSSPQQLFSQVLQTGHVLHDVFIRDGILFAANWDAGLKIYDVGGGTMGGTPSAPVLMGTVVTVGGNVHNVWWFHDPTTGAKKYAFVGEEQSGGAVGQASAGDLHVVDLSNMAQPREVAVYRVAGAGAHNFWMDEPRGILYAAYYNGGVRAIDARGDLGTCTPAQQTPEPVRCDLNLMNRQLAAFTPSGVYFWGVWGSGGSLYASDMNNGLWKLGTIVR